MDKKNNGMIWKIAAAAAGVLFIVMLILWASAQRRSNELAARNDALQTENSRLSSAASEAQTEAAAVTADEVREEITAVMKPEQILAHWTDDSQTKKQLSDYLRAVTDEGSADYIPPEERIAVFDLDGTILSETNPCYFDHLLLVYRVFQDPDYKDRASGFERETAAKILQWTQGGDYPAGMDTDHGRCIASAFSGMTVDEFEDYVMKFGSQPAPGYDGMTRAESLYVPMLEILDVLREYGFSSYIVSGTDRLIIRGGLKDTLGVPVNRIIGSDETIVASAQNGEDGLVYQIQDGDDLILGGDFIIKNLKMNKVSAIAQEIGIHPVLSFGNTTGDQSMADYTLTNPRYRSMAFMLCCDDTDREYGRTEKADKMYKLCDEHGWVPVSMKNDWTTIYGDGVVKNPASGLDIYRELYEENKSILEKADLPAYEYPGPELFYTVMYRYIIDEFGGNYEPSDVSIPAPVIIYEDDTDRSDIKVYGDFWLFNYDLNGDTLECSSGGSYPGCLHIASTDAGYEITGFEQVADGSDFTESAKEIFGSHYDTFIRVNSDENERERIRAQIIANYAAANDLPITAYQDFGWDAVPLPPENIDSFYSDLDAAA